MGDALAWQWGLWAPRILLKESKGEEIIKSPAVWPSEPGLWENYPEHVFAGRSGGNTICEHSQELTPGILELKATGVIIS